MSIKDWPSQERPRERLLKQSAKSLSDAELLAIFLRTGTRNISAVDLARQLLHQFGRQQIEVFEIAFYRPNLSNYISLN